MVAVGIFTVTDKLISMKIEDEIKQKSFRNQYHKVTINLIFTSGWLLHKQKIFFDRFGLTVQQFNVLRILRGQHPSMISTSEIKDRMFDKNSDASRIVDRLAHKSLVHKNQCPNDKRLVDVVISAKGLELLEKIDEQFDEMDEILKGITLNEAAELNRLLDKIRN